MKRIFVYILLCFAGNTLLAQEHVGPLYYHPPATNTITYNQNNQAKAKTTVNTLPFFEDFSGGGFFPDTAKWVDRKVYINNNMGVNTISRGVATFDAIDENGLPYEQSFKGLVRYTDSLTSQAFDLSVYSESDSLYLSFFYQPQGNGFDPQPEDSLMLYFKRANTTNPWTRVWRTEGRTLEAFQQVMVPITDANLFHNDFRFRFVNKASINNSDDHWHIDYIRLDANRSVNDTAVNDVAFTQQPTGLLGDYVFMPFHQYAANASAERAAQMQTAIRNNNTTAATVNYGFTARETITNTALGNGTDAVNLQAETENTITFPVYTNTAPAPQKNQPATYETKYYLQTSAGNSTTDNDTIIHNQHFHNYLAYDDGTAEKSYYLNLFATLPGKIAVEHHLNEPDTLKGLAIYFGRQVPLAYQKFFSIAVYSEIGFGGGAENQIYQEDFLVPSYLQQNSFWYYKFEKPVPLSAGKFFVATIQPALGGSDSLYIGLDVDRTQDNHVYYNVVNEWEKSTIQGAVMMRPLFGEFFPSDVPKVQERKPADWTIIPNPATDKIRFNYHTAIHDAVYVISDMQGRVMQQGSVKDAGWVDIHALTSGVYLATLYIDGRASAPQKITKL